MVEVAAPHLCRPLTRFTTFEMDRGSHQFDFIDWYYRSEYNTPSALSYAVNMGHLANGRPFQSGAVVDRLNPKEAETFADQESLRTIGWQPSRRDKL